MRSRNAICMTGDELEWEFPQLRAHLSRDVSFITSQELEDMYRSHALQSARNKYTKHTDLLYHADRQNAPLRQRSMTGAPRLR